MVYMDYDVYVDESGDLGFNFDMPFRAGGSSRYLTIAFLYLPRTLVHLPKRVVRDIYSKRGARTSIEIKAKEKNRFAHNTALLVAKHPEIELFGITVYKQNVAQHIRNDSNKLYNYMVGLSLCDVIKTVRNVRFIPDPRTIKVESGNSLVDYLQIKLWFEAHCNTVINNCPMESHQSLNLQFIDFVAHIIWKNYEDGEKETFRVLSGKLNLKQLFFP
jgi:hypothetical protein